MPASRAAAIVRRMHLSAIHLFPVKSAAAIPLSSASLDDFGLQHDRRWMVVDEQGRFVTAREVARLALLRIVLEDAALVLSSVEAGVVRVPLECANGAPRRSVRVWKDEVSACDVGDEAARFVSHHLGMDARLVRMPDDTLRQVRLDYARPGDQVGFADAFPLLVIGEGSVAELNRRLDAPLPMLRFRPNLVVAGTAPHEEDTWRRIRIGDVELDVLKPCDRCVVTTIDQTTGVAGKEPLRTLATYRRSNGKVYFGKYAVHRGRGPLQVGDEVTVLDTGPADPPL
jgi:uncharacterized protein YcbX